MRIVILKHILFQDFEKRLPIRFHGCRRPKLSNDTCLTLITFPHDVVVHSRSLINTLEKVLPTAEQIVVYAYNFTQESAECMMEKAVFFFQQTISNGRMEIR